QELAEPSAKGRGGSSTMPHKQNPVACAAILATTSRTPALVGTVLSNMRHENQRALGAWQSEWEVFPEIVRLVAGATRRLAALLPQLQFNVDHARRTLDLTRGLIFAEAVSMALSEKLGRGEAHHLVEEASARAQSSGRNLREVLLDENAITAHVSPADLDRLF